MLNLILFILTSKPRYNPFSNFFFCAFIPPLFIGKRSPYKFKSLIHFSIRATLPIIMEFNNSGMFKKNLVERLIF